MQMNTLRFSSLIVLSSVMAACLALWSTSRMTDFSRLSEDTLTRVTGTNSTQKGIGGYDCDTAIANGSKGVYISSAQCNATPNSSLDPTPDKNKQCFICQGDPSTTGYSSSTSVNAVKIVDSGKFVDCSKSPNGGASNFSTDGYCGYGANGYGTCQDGYSAPTNTACAGSFEQYNPQGGSVPPTGP